MHAVYHVVYNGPKSGEAPTQDKLDDWIDTYELTTNVVVPDDPDAALEAFEQRECTYLVETEGMTITWKMCSCAGGSCTPSAVLGLDELRAALDG